MPIKKKTKHKTLSTKQKRTPPHLKSKDIPVTKEMLFEVRNELKSEVSGTRSDIKSLEKRMESRFLDIESQFKKIDIRFLDMESRFAKIDSRLSNMDTKFDDLIATVHKISLLVEDQNARNRYVLDGYGVLTVRLDQHDTRFDHLENKVESISLKSKSSSSSK